MVKTLKSIPLYLGLYSIYLLFGIAFLLFINTSEVIIWFSTHRTSFWDTAFQYITKGGEEYGFYMFALAMLFYRYRYAILSGLSGVFVLIVTYLMKISFAHPRPRTYFDLHGLWNQYKAIDGVYMVGGNMSFPSGHTAAAFCLMTMICLVIKKKWIQFFAIHIALLVGFSRIYLGQHFYKDVVLGSFVGVVCAVLMYQFVHYIHKKWMDSNLIQSLQQKRDDT